MSRSTVSTIKSCLHAEENNDCPCDVVMFTIITSTLALFNFNYNEKYDFPFHHNYNGDKTGGQMILSDFCYFVADARVVAI